MVSTHLGNPYNGYINPYYWVDDHPLLYGNNGNLDPSTFEKYARQNGNLPLSRDEHKQIFGHHHPEKDWPVGPSFSSMSGEHSPDPKVGSALGVKCRYYKYTSQIEWTWALEEPTFDYHEPQNHET